MLRCLSLEVSRQTVQRARVRVASLLRRVILVKLVKTLVDKLPGNPRAFGELGVLGGIDPLQDFPLFDLHGSAYT